MDKDLLMEAKAMGLQPMIDPSILPDTTEEAEIFMDQNMKTNAEIAAQLGTALTLDWNEFDQNVYRRAVEDLVVCGMSVVKRENDPNYGITTKYIDPAFFLHSYTDDPNMSDIVYGAHIKRVSIQELKRQAGSQLTEEQYENLGKTVMHKNYNDSSAFHNRSYDRNSRRYTYGYDDYLIDIMDFEFLSVDCVYNRPLLRLSLTVSWLTSKAWRMFSLGEAGSFNHCRFKISMSRPVCSTTGARMLKAGFRTLRFVQLRTASGISTSTSTCTTTTLE
jgi:hypothetical protein